MKQSKVCEGCENKKDFSTHCFYHWEDKKVCTQYMNKEGNQIYKVRI